MAKLKSRDILQINATIIAGMLILMTISALYSNPATKLTELDDIIFSKQLELDGYTFALSQLEDRLKEISNINRWYIQNQILDTHYKIYQLEEQINNLVEKQKEIEKSNEVKSNTESIINSRNIIIIVITPFVISSIFATMPAISLKLFKKFIRKILNESKIKMKLPEPEEESSVEDDKETLTIIISKIIMALGFLILLIGIAYLSSIPLTE